MLSDGFYPFVIISFQSAIWKADLIAYLTLPCDKLSCLSLPHVFTIFNRIRNNYELIQIADFMISKFTHRLNENGESWKQNAQDEEEDARKMTNRIMRKNDNKKSTKKCYIKCKATTKNTIKFSARRHTEDLLFFCVFFSTFIVETLAENVFFFARDKSSCDKSINANFTFSIIPFENPSLCILILLSFLFQEIERYKAISFSFKHPKASHCEHNFKELWQSHSARQRKKLHFSLRFDISCNSQWMSHYGAPSKWLMMRTNEKWWILLDFMLNTAKQVTF